MARVDLAYVQRFRDRHGRLRHYFRRPGHKRVPLPGEPGSKAFMAAYAEALASTREPVGAGLIERSVSDLIARYYLSPAYKGLGDRTRYQARLILDRFREAYGTALTAHCTVELIEELFGKMADRPGAARQLRKRLALVFDYAVKPLKWIPFNPIRQTERIKVQGDGFRAWTEEDIALFEKKYPSGTRERLAMALLLYTTQRRSDVSILGRQHMKRGKLTLTQFKGRNSDEPTVVVIPIHPTLKIELDQVPKDQLTFVVTKHGKPFTHAGFTKWFARAARKAGLPPDSTPHGLRKAGARQLAEAGGTEHEIASVTGHRSLKEVRRYTKSARNERLAESAMGRWADQSGNEGVKPNPPTAVKPAAGT
jgi:integrase